MAFKINKPTTAEDFISGANKLPDTEEQGRVVESAPKAAGVKPKPTVSNDEYPWSSKSSDSLTQLNSRVPEDLFYKLKYLGSTTYGETMSSLIIRALKKEVDAELKKRGIK